jgi:hypothetical protein
MKQATLSNAIQCIIAIIFATASTATGICTLTWHNIMFGLMGAGFARMLYVDDYYGESVKQFIQRKRGK